ncbi:hypothetical protein ACS0TY_002360 [Phlomoides rotata]
MFDDRSSDSSSRSFLPLMKPKLSSITGGLRRGFDRSSERIKSLRRWSNDGRNRQNSSSSNKILDPQEPFLQRWNKIFVLSCVIAVSLDPLFFYIPFVDPIILCLKLDHSLEITACVLRSLLDMFYIFHILLQFRTGFIAPCSRVFGRGELVNDSKAIAKRYLLSYFIIDILSILPLPQMVIVMVIPTLNAPLSLVTKDLLRIIIFCQYIPRLWRIYPLFKEVTRTSGLFTETAWAGAAINLFLYMLASHVLGAFWYLFAIERKEACWRIACHNSNRTTNDLYCGDPVVNNSFLNTSCPLLEQNDIKSWDDFDFGIALDALQSRVIESDYFLRKFFYCFWWGLRNLSSFGQNLKTSTYVGEILFAVFVSVIGLILFSLLIGNMQKLLGSLSVRVEEMRVKRGDTDHWMSHRMLPEELRARIRRYEQYKWQQNRGVEEDSLIRNLPKDLRRDIKRHLCWTLLTKVPMFEKMDEQLLDAMCSHLKPVLYTVNSFILREGDPVDEMLFVMRGNILTTTTNGGRTGFYNAVGLVAGDFCGEELLTWALDPNSSSTLPISTRTVHAVTDVEAFCLLPDDLKNVASQFRRLNSRQLQHTFRFCSEQWRTWGACFIQVAWRKYCRRKIERSLEEAEDRRQEALSSEGGGPSLHTVIYASRFANNMIRNLRRHHPPNTLSSPRLPTLLPQKPAEPDFTAQDHS